MMKHVISFSGGLASAECAYRKKFQFGTDDLILLFADTLVEDDDLYRFILEVAADIFEVNCHFAINLPPLDQEIDRKKALSDLRSQANDLIPGLKWIAEGRNIWEIFFDEHLIGNTRADPCSRIAKRELCRQWLEKNCNPSETIVSIGYDWGEADRFERSKKYWDPWKMDAPLMDPPFLHKTQIMTSFQRRGIQPPRLYSYGFPHNNCHGACVKAGLDQWRAALDLFPDVFAYHEARENEFRAKFGNYSILRDQSGSTTPRTLTSLRLEWEGWTPQKRARKRQLWDKPLQIPLFTADSQTADWGGCGCFEVPTASQPDDEETALPAIANSKS